MNYRSISKRTRTHTRRKGYDMKTTEDRLRVIELRSQGMSIAKIAKATKMAKDTVVNILTDSKEEVAAMQALELDALYEEQRITSTERIKRLAEIQTKIKEEVDGRDLSDVPTEKLIDLYLKTSTALDGAIIEPRILSTKQVEDAKREREYLEGI